MYIVYLLYMDYLNENSNHVAVLLKGFLLEVKKKRKQVSKYYLKAGITWLYINWNDLFHHSMNFRYW